MIFFGEKLRLYRQASLEKGFEASQNRVDPLKTILQHQERRPGARVFSRSGAVGDVPGLFIQRRQLAFQVLQGKVERAFDVADLILVCRPCIQQDRALVLDGIDHFFCIDAGHLVLIGQNGVAAQAARASVNKYTQNNHKHSQQQPQRRELGFFLVDR